MKKLMKEQLNQQTISFLLEREYRIVCNSKEISIILKQNLNQHMSNI